MKKHRCGGNLRPFDVKIRKKTGAYFQNYTVKGFKCDRCGEELITRDAAIELDNVVRQLGQIWRDWNIPPIGRTMGTREDEYIPTTGTVVRVPYYIGNTDDLLVSG